MEKEESPDLFKKKPSGLGEVIKHEAKEWGDAIIWAIVIAVFLRTFFFQIYKIPTTSMVPTLRQEDKIFVSRLVYGPKLPFTNFRFPGVHKPLRGEIVVFIPPNDRAKAYIKRLIGLPGDKVLIKDGDIYVNGKKIDDSRISKNYYYNQGDWGMVAKEIVVPENKYFFLGDNSIASSDGRFWGFADEKDVIGKAILIWWPPSRAAMLN